MKQEKPLTIKIINRVQLNNSVDLFERKSAEENVEARWDLYEQCER